jgi:transcriptional regulator with XRE-family HTH domain
MAARSGSVGSMLRSARERRGLSVPQVAAATKISKTFIEALERDDVSRLPGGISGRAFVRAYAGHVGLDPDEALRVFVEQSAEATRARPHASALEVEDHQAIDSQRRAASAFLQLVLMSVPLAGLILYAGRMDRRAEPSVGISRLAEPAPADMKPTPEGSASLLVVRVSAARDCRIVAIVDGAEKLRRDFKSGEQEVLEVTREIVLTVSDAGAISMTLNGTPAKPFGSAGQSASIRLTPETFPLFVVKR